MTPLSEVALHSSSDATARSSDGEEEDRILKFYKSEMAKSNTMLYVTRVSFCIFVVFAMYLLGMLFFFRTSSRDTPPAVQKVIFQSVPALECQASNLTVPAHSVKVLPPMLLNKSMMSNESEITVTSVATPSNLATPSTVLMTPRKPGSLLHAPGPTDHLVFCFFNHTSYRRRAPMSFDIPEIPVGFCTHVVYSSAGLDDNFSVRVTDDIYDLSQGGYKRFLALRNRHYTVKFLIALGETRKDWTNFRDIVSDHTIVRTFAQNLVRWVSGYGFDGVVFNWKYPRKSDRWKFTDMIREVKSRFALKRLLVSVVLPHQQQIRRAGFDVARLGDLADFLLFKMYGDHNSSTPKTTFPITDEDVSLFPKVIRSEIGKAQFKKACFLLPLVGLAFRLANEDHHHVGASVLGPGDPGNYTKVPGILAYNEICAGNWSIVSAEMFGTFAVRGNQWVGYHDAENLKNVMKVSHRKYDVGCFGLWELSYEDFKGFCGTSYPIVQTCYRSLRSDSADDSGWTE